MTDMLIIISSVLVAAAGYLWRRLIVKRLKDVEAPTKGQLRAKKLSMLVIIAGLYVLAVKVIELLFGKPSSRGFDVQIVAPRVDVFGLSLSTTVIYSWAIIIAIVIIALILRLTVFPRFKDVPRGAQNIIELAIESAVKYTKSTAHGVGEFLASYIFTIAIFLVGCAITEMLGFRTPASDITLTGALAILTFLFINIYGFKTKGVGGRLKSLASPTPIIFPHPNYNGPCRPRIAGQPTVRQHARRPRRHGPHLFGTGQLRRRDPEPSGPVFQCFPSPDTSVYLYYADINIYKRSN
jgi:F-type H+-transporting ATPase subunit a